MTLEPLGGRTKLTTRSRFPSAEVLQGALATGMTQGAIETYDRLDAVLVELAADQR